MSFKEFIKWAVALAIYGAITTIMDAFFAGKRLDIFALIFKEITIGNILLIISLAVAYCLHDDWLRKQNPN